MELLHTFDWLTLVPFETEHAFVVAELEATLRQHFESTRIGSSRSRRRVHIASGSW